MTLYLCPSQTVIEFEALKLPTAKCTEDASSAFAGTCSRAAEESSSCRRAAPTPWQIARCVGLTASRQLPQAVAPFQREAALVHRQYRLPSHPPSVRKHSKLFPGENVTQNINTCFHVSLA